MTTNTDAGQLTDEQIVEAGYMHTVETDEPLFTFDRKELIAMVRELVSASKPAAPEGWRKGQWGYQTLFNAICDAVTTPGPSVSISVQAFEDSMLAASSAAPAQSGEPIYQIQVKTGSESSLWFDVEIEEWERKDRNDFDRRIVYAGPQTSQPAQSDEKVGKKSLVLSAAQLLEALDFIAPDRATDAEQLENEIAIEHGEGYAGQATYCWCAEYPEEGSWVLDGKSVLTAPQPAQTAQSGEPVDYDRVVSICEAHGICLPVDCIEIVVEILRLAARSGDDELSDAARDVLTERQRQTSAEGWTPEHDDAHDDCEMAIAAACYAESAAGFHHPSTIPHTWPWDSMWWKPTTRRRDLVKAAALLLAEIERIDRAAVSSAEGEAK